MFDAGEEFVIRHTRLQAPPAVPEIQLYLATEFFPVWQSVATETVAGEALPPFWAFAWAGGQALARYMIDYPAEVAGKRVLDFASGSGMCGVAAALAGAAHVTAVDIDPLSAAAIGLTARANRVSVEVWQRDLLNSAPPEMDLLLAGDVWYEEPLAVAVLPWLLKAHAQGTRVLLGDPGRTYFPQEHTVLLARYEVPTTRDLEDSDRKWTGVYTFRPRSIEGRMLETRRGDPERSPGPPEVSVS